MAAQAETVGGQFVNVKLRKGYKLVVGFKGGKPTYQEGPWSGSIDIELAVDNIQKFENQDEIRKAAGLPDHPRRIHAMERFREVEEERRTREESRIQAIAASAAVEAVKQYLGDKDEKKPRKRKIKGPPVDRAVGGASTR